ncbi:MAG: hypothetical protein L3I99_05800 [Sulfurimonas sp.]|nr:hypothetical protein [Sulfurimonas sp.]
MNKIKPRPTKPMDELPEWAYTKSEFEDICWSTAEIINGVRMVFDNKEYKRQKYYEQNSTMLKIGIL